MEKVLRIYKLLSNYDFMFCQVIFCKSIHVAFKPLLCVVLRFIAAISLVLY